MAAPKKVTKRIKDQYENVLDSEGEDQFYRFVLGHATLNIRNRAEVVILDQSDSFFSLSRSTGNIKYFTIGKILRRAAHKLYREARRRTPDYPINNKFLNIVS